MVIVQLKGPPKNGSCNDKAALRLLEVPLGQRRAHIWWVAPPVKGHLKTSKNSDFPVRKSLLFDSAESAENEEALTFLRIGENDHPQGADSNPLREVLVRSLQGLSQSGFEILIAKATDALQRVCFTIPQPD